MSDPTRAAGEAGSDLRTRLDEAQWVIDNIFTIARREQRRAEIGKDLRVGSWAHVQRLCERTGAQERQVGVLRVAGAVPPALLHTVAEAAQLLEWVAGGYAKGVEERCRDVAAALRAHGAATER